MLFHIISVWLALNEMQPEIMFDVTASHSLFEITDLTGRKR